MTRNATTLPERSVQRGPFVRTENAGELGLPEAAAALGGVVLFAAAGGRGRGGVAMRVAGAALLGFAVRPLIVHQVAETGGRRRALAASASVDVARPTRQVFAFFKDFECFPKVINGLRSVVDHQDGRSHWEMYTPSGEIVAWDVVVTKFVPQSVIGWESVPGSPVELSGVVRFTPRGPNVTTVSLELVFRPEHTGFVDALRVLTRRHTRDRLSAALDRARFYIESLPPAPEDAAPAE